MAGQLLGIPAIGLDPISSLRRDQRRSNDFAGDTELRQLPVQRITGDAGFVAGSNLLDRTQLVNHFSDGFETIGNGSQRMNFSVGLCYGNSDGFGVDIQTKKSYFTHDQLLSYAALRRWFHDFAA